MKNDDICVRIAELRSEAGLSQSDLAKKAGIYQPNIARIENGHRPSLATLEKIAEALGCKVDLISRHENK